VEEGGEVFPEEAAFLLDLDECVEISWERRGK
jgi:hypothetical protein